MSPNKDGGKIEGLTITAVIPICAVSWNCTITSSKWVQIFESFESNTDPRNGGNVGNKIKIRIFKSEGIEVLLIFLKVIQPRHNLVWYELQLIWFTDKRK